MLMPTFSRQRQAPLLSLMQEQSLDAVIIGTPQLVYYFTAHWSFWQHQAALVLFADGRSVLFTANAPDRDAAADDVRAYPANARATLRQDQPEVVGQLVNTLLRETHAATIGLDASAVTAHVAIGFEGRCSSIDPEICQMRRLKFPDELALMKRAIACCGAMYARARELIEPGVPEVKVFAQLQATAVETAGEPLSALLGNDYACGVIGGPPRPDHTAADGQLYILDLGPVYRGYFSDNARTIAVNRHPTDQQARAHEIVLKCLSTVERIAKPGVRCRDIWRAVNDYLQSEGRPEMTHHLGHGVGLSPHEFPHLNPEWDDTLMEGEIFTAEPGQYGEELTGGIRLENQYLVTRTGIELLTDFPLSLA